MNDNPFSTNKTFSKEQNEFIQKYKDANVSIISYRNCLHNEKIIISKRKKKIL